MVTSSLKNSCSIKMILVRHSIQLKKVAGKDGPITYDTMKATVTVKVTKEGKVLTTVVNHASTGGFASSANDKEFNNKVRPPETPEFNPEKYIPREQSSDLTSSNKL